MDKRKLSDLNCVCVRAKDSSSFREGVPFDRAHGIMFDCPKCGNHKILVWLAERGVPNELTPLPRWRIAQGTKLDTLYLEPSMILLSLPCGWHGFVRNGEAVDA